MIETERTGWWGSYPVPLEQVLLFQIGPLTLRLQREHHEWRIATEERDAHADAPLVLAEREDHADLREAPDLVRLGVRHTTASILLSPLLADRPVVTRPDRPFLIPPKDEVTLYVSTPLWLCVRSAEGVVLLESPFQRPSDTWFGPSTLQGQVCYASRTSCRLELSEVPRRPHRALTPLRILNKAETPLELERMNLPVAHLSLYASEDGDLWTQTLTIERLSGQEPMPASLPKEAPPGVTGAKLVSGPREEPPHNTVVRAFSSLFQ